MRATRRNTIRRYAAVLGCCTIGSAAALAAGEPAFDAQGIRQLVEQHAVAVLQDAPFAQGASRVEVRTGSLDSRLDFAPCAQALQVELELPRPSGRANAKVSCATPTPWYLYVPVELAVYRDVVVATRAMRPGELIAAGDVTLEERDVLAGGTPALGRLEDVIGHQLRRAVGASAVIGNAAVELPLLVRRGEHINLSARSGGINVSVSAEALANGRSGERIRVRNLQSQRVVEATVTGPGKAEVI
jgi:flagella basal body P-ring formation protein FlgA